MLGTSSSSWPRGGTGRSRDRDFTDWSEYRTLDYTRIHAAMERPAFLFDGRNLLDADELHRIGFNVHPIGRPDRTRL